MSLYQNVSRRWLEKSPAQLPRQPSGHIIVSPANLPAVKRVTAYAYWPSNDHIPVPAANTA